MSKITKTVLIVVLLLVISQWILVKLVYANKLNGGLAYWLAKTYNLPAAKVEDSKRRYKISLADFFQNRSLLEKNLEQSESSQPSNNLDELAWQKTLKDYWLKYFAEDNKLEVTASEVDEYMASIVGADTSFDEYTNKNYKLSWDKFKQFVIIPYILGNKVYAYLLDNYNDQEGIRQAQNAYEELETGRDFTEVSKEFSTDTDFSAESFWLKQEDLVGYYEPINNLKTGEFSKIVMMPGGYVIWYVAAITEDGLAKAWQIKSLFVKARPFEDFFQDYVKSVKIDKKIK